MLGARSYAAGTPELTSGCGGQKAPHAGPESLSNWLTALDAPGPHQACFLICRVGTTEDPTPPPHPAIL